MRIIFVRHGEPDYQKDCLTETGHKQAELVAKRLVDENISEIWASPLGRARETAEHTSKLLGLPVKELDFMKEIYWAMGDGPLYMDGHPWTLVDEMAMKGFDLNSPDWRETEFFKENRVKECVDVIDIGVDKWLEELGYVRKGSFYEHTIEEKEHRTIALFSHGGSSSVAMGHILNLSFPYMCGLLHIDFTGVTVLRFGRKKGNIPMPCLELANDVHHLRNARF